MTIDGMIRRTVRAVMAVVGAVGLVVLGLALSVLYQLGFGVAVYLGVALAVVGLIGGLILSLYVGGGWAVRYLVHGRFRRSRPSRDL